MTELPTLDRPYGQQPETAAAAARFIVRTREDCAELLMALGLAHDPQAIQRGPEIAPGGDCPICGNKLPAHGVCRRSNRCRESARARGESA